MANLQYIGARYVPKYYENSVDPSSSEWEPGKVYEALIVVTYQDDSYISKIPVPSNIGDPASYPAYWAKSSFNAAAVAALQQEVGQINSIIGSGDLDNDADNLTDGINTNHKDIYSSTIERIVKFEQIFNGSFPTGHVFAGICSDNTYLYLLQSTNSWATVKIYKIRISDGLLVDTGDISGHDIAHINCMCYYDGYLYVCDTTQYLYKINASSLTYDSRIDLIVDTGGINIFQVENEIYMVRQEKQQTANTVYIFNTESGTFNNLFTVYTRKTGNNPQSLFATNYYIFKLSNRESFVDGVLTIDGNYIDVYDYNGNLSQVIISDSFKDVEFEDFCIVGEDLYAITSHGDLLKANVDFIIREGYSRISLDEWYKGNTITQLFRGSASDDNVGYPTQKINIGTHHIVTRFNVKTPSNAKNFGKLGIFRFALAGLVFDAGMDMGTTSANGVVEYVGNTLKLSAKVEYSVRGSISNGVFPFQLSHLQMCAISLTDGSILGSVSLSATSASYDYSAWQTPLENFFTAIDWEFTIRPYYMAIVNGLIGNQAITF